MKYNRTERAGPRLDGVRPGYAQGPCSDSRDPIGTCGLRWIQEGSPAPGHHKRDLVAGHRLTTGVGDSNCWTDRHFRTGRCDLGVSLDQLNLGSGRAGATWRARALATAGWLIRHGKLATAAAEGSQDQEGHAKTTKER